MCQKIKQNLKAIGIMLSSIAGIFLIINMAGFLDQNIDEIDFVNLASYALIFASVVIMFVLSLKDKYTINDIKVPGILFLIGRAISYLEIFYNNPKFVNMPLLILSVAVLILWIISMFSNKTLNALKVLLIAFGAYSLCFALNASIYQMAMLLLINQLALPLFIKEENNKENEEINL